MASTVNPAGRNRPVRLNLASELRLPVSRVTVTTMIIISDAFKLARAPCHGRAEILDHLRMTFWSVFSGPKQLWVVTPTSAAAADSAPRPSPGIRPGPPGAVSGRPAQDKSSQPPFKFCRMRGKFNGFDLYSDGAPISLDFAQRLSQVAHVIMRSRIRIQVFKMIPSRLWRANREQIRR